jgi:hypothetical protein
MIPQKTMTSTSKPICPTFLKNCPQESSAVGVGILISNPAGMAVFNRSGITFAKAGLINPNYRNTTNIIKTL